MTDRDGSVEMDERPETQWRAGFVERVGAFSIDLILIIWVYNAGLHLVVRQQLDGGVLSFLKWYAVILVGLGVGALLYFTLLNARGRQTLGKRVFGLCVVQSDGTLPGWRQALFRSLAYLVSEGAFYVGFLWVLWDRKREAWHDKLSGTAVACLRPQTPTARALAFLSFLCLVASSLLPSTIVKQRFRAFTTPTSSMVMTLLPGDYFIADLGFLRFHEVARGDVIVFAPPKGGEQAYIKRCVALEGDDVRVRRNLLLVDGMPVVEPYVFLSGMSSPYANFGPLRVPRDRVFVLGDNRDNSLDSRYFGPLQRNLIVGRADLIYWSMEPEGGSSPLRPYRPARALTRGRSAGDAVLESHDGPNVALGEVR